MNEKIRLLVEQRKRDALKKGLSPKLTAIARHLGRPVARQGGDFPWLGAEGWQHDRRAVYSADDSWREWDDGYLYDGLSAGVNLQIRILTYTDDDDETRYSVYELRTTFNGDEVFREDDGRLTGYSPGAWEDWVERLAGPALAAQARFETRTTAEGREKKRAGAKSVLGTLRKLWGF